MGVEFIERRRRESVKAEAQKLFDTIVDYVITQTPGNEVEFRVDWQAHQPGIDEMVFAKTKDLFQEIGTSLEISRSTSSTVRGTLRDPENGVQERDLGTFFWSRSPGKFVNKTNGKPAGLSLKDKDGKVIAFDGTVREWYETLVETLIDAGNAIHRDVKEAPDTIYVGPDVGTILECSVLYRPNFQLDESKRSHVGTLCSRYKIFRDESLPRNKAIVSLTKDGVRNRHFVEIIDMNII